MHRRLSGARRSTQTSAAGSAEYPQGIAFELQPQPLPHFGFEATGRYPYGARSEAAVYVGHVLSAEVPGVRDGSLELVAIARRPGVLSKVAVRPRPGRVVPISVGIGADHIAHVRDRLDGERVQVVAWQRSAPVYIAAALGLGEVPPIRLLSGIQHAQVLLGEIDVRGIDGWRGLNTVLASALTGWRIRLEPVAITPAWQRLESAMRGRRSLTAVVVGRTDRGPRVEVLGLYAVLGGPASDSRPVGQEVTVRVTRMNPDEGRIFVSDRLSTPGQLGFPLT